MNGIALSKLLVELKSPRHAIKVQILSSSMKLSFLLLPLNKYYQFQLLLCLCCEKLSFLGDFGVEKAKWGQGNVGRSQNRNFPPQPPFVKYGCCHFWVAMVGMFWIFIFSLIGTKTDSIRYSFKTETRIQKNIHFLKI